MKIKKYQPDPDHDCNPEPEPELKPGYLRMRRMPLFNECRKCYKKLELTPEQLEIRLNVLNIALDIVKNKE